MKIQKRWLMAAALLLLLVASACQGNGAGQSAEDGFQLERARIGVMTGTTGEAHARSAYPEAQISDFANVMDAVAALKAGRLDAVITADVTCRNIERENEDLERLEETLTNEHVGVGIKKGNDALLAGVNEVIAELKSDGTLEDMAERWVETYPPEYVEIEESDSDKVLRVGTDATRMPFTYMDADRKIIGFSPELSRRIGLALDMKVEFVSMEFSALISALESGKIDCIVDLMAATEERKLAINFSDDYYISGQNALKRREGDAPVSGAATAEFRAEDFAGKSIGFGTGTVFAEIVKEHIPDAEQVYLNTTGDLIASLTSGKVDAIMADDAALRKMAAQTSGIKVLLPFITEDQYGVVAGKENVALIEQLNGFIAQSKENGVFDDMQKRWIDTADSPPMPDIPEGSNGILTLATSGDTDGFSYYYNGEVVGFDIELAKRFAQYMDMELEIDVISFDGILPAVQSGKADFAADLITITEERRQNVGFSDPYYIGGSALAVYDVDVAHKETVWESIEKSFYQNLIVEDRWKMIVEGLGISLVITLFSFVLATVLGFGVCGLKMSRNPVLKGIGDTYVTVLRGTPILVLLMITFYVIFAKSDISGTVVAIIAFGANGAAFIGEILRSAILTVDKGQVEAARSMGFSKAGAFLTVTFPQAVRVAFPVYKSEFISMFKMTSIVGYIAIVDLTKAGDIIRSRTYDAFFPLIVVALVYLASASIMVSVFDFIDRLTDKRARARRNKRA